MIGIICMTVDLAEFYDMYENRCGNLSKKIESVGSLQLVERWKASEVCNLSKD